MLLHKNLCSNCISASLGCTWNIGALPIQQCEEFNTENKVLLNTSFEDGKDQNEIISKSNIKVLCGNCVNLKFCVFAKHAIAPVLYCEEYQDN
ncbi:MAG: hypothetical protein JJT77_03610 [Crocinitomicaceae bacterium]|jgi:hypothetical protein|nr:hypothetical protein [Crocinitomicaceae bacterium]